MTGPAALFVTTIPATLEAFLLPFADHFRAKGWRVDALANGATGTEGLAAHFDRRYDAGWSRSPLHPGNLSAARRVRAIVADGGYDVVHVHTPIASLVTRFALRGLRGPSRPVVVYTAHGFHFHRGGRALPNTVFRAMERVAARWTDFLVTINDDDFAAARALGTIPADRVRLIRGIGVDCETLSPGARPDARARVRAELDVPADALLVTMVAEFTPTKRHALALDALALTRDPRIVLGLVGDGPLLAGTRAAVAARGLDARVRFTGFRRDVPDLLAASDLALLVSDREGLPRSVLEAMALGLPVVGTDTRGISDAVGPRAGWIVPADPAALARALDEAAADPPEVARRGAKARERACNEFALTGVIAAYDALYEEALASRA